MEVSSSYVDLFHVRFKGMFHSHADMSIMIIETCAMQERKQNDHSCLVIEGRLSIFLSELNLINLFQLQIAESIKAMMDVGSLNDCHPAIVNVTFIDIGLSDSDVETLAFESDDDERNDVIVIEISGWRSSWIAAGAVMSSLVVLVVVTRYRYSITVAEDCGSNDAHGVSDSDSSGAFVDLSNLERNDIEDERDIDADIED